MSLLKITDYKPLYLKNSAKGISNKFLYHHFRFSHRRTAINILVILSCSCSLAMVSHSTLILVSNKFLCISTFIFFPGLLLLQKLTLTAMAVVRHMFVLWKGLVYRDPSNLAISFCCSLPAFIGAFIPALTMVYGPHSHLNKCLLILEDPGSIPFYGYLFAYFILFGNSIVIDIVCFTRILNYMRKNSVRVTMIASTAIERIKVLFCKLNIFDRSTTQGG